MLDRRRLLTSAAAVAGLALAARPAEALHVALIERFEVVRFVDETSADIRFGRAHRVVRQGEVFNGYTLMAVVPGEFVIFENLTAIDGKLLVVDTTGERHSLGKTAEATTGDPAGDLAEDQIRKDSDDILARKILAQKGDPAWTDVTDIFPPIQSLADDVCTFVGAPGRAPTALLRGGRCGDFDPAVYQPTLAAIRRAGRVRTGLVGGYLPVARFVFPEESGSWTEFAAFAPMVADRPVRYRVMRVEGGKLAWARHISPGSDTDVSADLYRDLAAVKTGWDTALAPAMAIDLPDARMADMARHSLVRLLMTPSPQGNRALAAWGLAATPMAAVPQDTTTRTVLGLPVTETPKTGALDTGALQTSAALAATHGCALIAADRPREALLTTYAAMAHAYSRGTWTAPALRPLPDGTAAAYSPDSQAGLPLLVRSLLVFEGPDALWLGRAMPRQWLDDRLVFVDRAATRWGRISFAVDSQRRENRIAVRVDLPEAGIAVPTIVRLRSVNSAPMRSVRVNGKAWKGFDPSAETVTLPAGMGGEILIETRY